MTTDNQTTTTIMKREIAEKILKDGKVTRGGVTVHIFNNILSDLEPITNEDLLGTDFVINRLGGEIDTEFGPAWIFEIGERPLISQNSWLVGKTSVIGKNIDKQAAKIGGMKEMLPLWVHLSQRHSQDGRSQYWCLETPRVIMDAIEPTETARPQQPLAGLEDLPF